MYGLYWAKDEAGDYFAQRLVVLRDKTPEEFLELRQLLVRSDMEQIGATTGA